MSTAYDNLTRILSSTTSVEQRLSAMRGFASELHWTPSFEMHNSFGVSGVDDHLVVEHGLENSAIISFLKSPRRVVDLDPIQLRSLLAISFNNLVEWHIFVSETEVRYINNLTEPYFDRIFVLTRSSTDCASVQQFDKLTTFEFASQRHFRSIQACDDVLIKIISHWKRLLKADYRTLSNEDISAIFNSIIFVRACEDQARMQGELPPRLLLRTLEAQLEGTPRFAVDFRGNYAVSHSPFLVPKKGQYDPVFLKFFCAVFNSSVCHWFISTHAPKYSRGYNRIEVPLLKSIPVPDPAHAHPAAL
jgi:hypothetical protein